MKGFVPPPRMAAVERAAAHHAHHHDDGRHQREGPGRKAGNSRQGPDRTLLVRGVFVTVNQTLDAELAKDMARQFGADTTVITLRRASCEGHR